MTPACSWQLLGAPGEAGVPLVTPGRSWQLLGALDDASLFSFLSLFLSSLSGLSLLSSTFALLFSLFLSLPLSPSPLLLSSPLSSHHFPLTPFEKGKE